MRIVGVQLHHSVYLSDAVRGLANACAGLSGAVKRTDDESLRSLLARAQSLIADISIAESRARRRMEELYIEDPHTFISAREGEIPWPDERRDGFIPRCTCYDRCLVHDHGVLDAHCNCDKSCPQHEQAA